MATYGRSYDSVEEMLHRARVFATNLAHIKAVKPSVVVAAFTSASQ